MSNVLKYCERRGIRYAYLHFLLQFHELSALWHASDNIIAIFYAGQLTPRDNAAQTQAKLRDFLAITEDVASRAS